MSHSKKQSKAAVLKSAMISPLLQIMDECSLRRKDITGIADLSKNEIELLLNTAALLKQHIDDDAQALLCKGQTLAMLFEKPSLRTRVTFDVGMKQLGGHAIFLEGPLGVRESTSDIAKNLDRWADGIMARTFLQSTVQELAENAEIPVINGLSDLEHPCQALADLLTIQEHKGSLAGVKIAYIGDPNNVSNSLFLAAVKFGAECIIACPPDYLPEQEIWSLTCAEAAGSYASIKLTHDPFEAASAADVIYTDTWVSMGQEEQAAVKEKVFAPYQVNNTLMSVAKQDAIVMHCLPAHKGYEITAEVIDGPQSVVFDQAENRLHAQKAILALVL
jgi:ornithine carbamoyltransferase